MVRYWKICGCLLLMVVWCCVSFLVGYVVGLMVGCVWFMMLMGSCWFLF